MSKLSMFFYSSGYVSAFPFTPTLILLPYGSAVFLLNSIWSLENSANKRGHKWQQTLNAFNEPSVDLFLGFNWEKNTLP